VEYVDSKDSGHETSSIHTENSENSSTASSPAESSVQTPSPTLHKSFLQQVREHLFNNLPSEIEVGRAYFWDRVELGLEFLRHERFTKQIRLKSCSGSYLTK
jgi:hypothetical protein